jgi:hypothetical protein
MPVGAWRNALGDLGLGDISLVKEDSTESRPFSDRSHHLSLLINYSDRNVVQILLAHANWPPELGYITLDDYVSRYCISYYGNIVQ